MRQINERASRPAILRHAGSSLFPLFSVCFPFSRHARSGFTKCGTVYMEDNTPRVAYQWRAK